MNFEKSRKRQQRIKELNKKGITVQLSWIYIAIAGAFILFFFARIVVFIQSEGSKDITDNIRNQLDDAFIKVRADKLYYQELDVPRTFYEERCENGRIYYSVGKSTFQAQGVYSPSEVKPKLDKLLLWTLPWEVPYWVDNMLYISSPGVLYVFVEDQWGHMDDLLNDPVYSLPENMSYVTISHDAFKYFASNEDGGPFAANKDQTVFSEVNERMKDYFRVKFVFFDVVKDFQIQSFTLPVAIMKRGISVVNIIPKNSLDGVGWIQFLYYDGRGSRLLSEGFSSYVGRALSVASLFAEGKTQYDCNYEYFLKRWSDVNDYYRKRYELIAQTYVPTSICASYIYSKILDQNYDPNSNYAAEVNNVNAGSEDQNNGDSGISYDDLLGEYQRMIDELRQLVAVGGDDSSVDAQVALLEQIYGYMNTEIKQINREVTRSPRFCAAIY